TRPTCSRWTFCFAALVAVSLAVAPAHSRAQSRALGPPAGGADLEGGDTSDQPPQNPEANEPAPPPAPKPKPKPKPQDRLRNAQGAPPLLDIPISAIPNYRGT